MSALPRLGLDKRRTHRVLHGHCWVFRGEIAENQDLPPDGAAVEVADARGRILGCGLYSAASAIAVRLYTRRAGVDFSEAFMRQRLAQAVAWRDAVMPGRPARRLVSSEADQVPGLIVDAYGDRLVVQTTTAGMDLRLAQWTRILVDTVKPAQIVERNDLAVRRLEGLPERCGILHGGMDTTVRVRVGMADTEIALMDPHKTGSYLDQQLNHEAVARLVRPGERVLDAFCHLAGFGVHALLAGAGAVVAVDSADASIAGAGRAAAIAGVGARMATVCTDAFAWLRAQEGLRETYDVVVLDPPSFTRGRDSVPGALRGYRELHLRGLRLLQPGGRLATFSCSHHVPAADFLATLVEAAADAPRAIRLITALDASPDHPVLPLVPETAYLKGFVVEVLAD
jgi:23S rRNA (cytosine1962-C5)-methyltransferase